MVLIDPHFPSRFPHDLPPPTTEPPATAKDPATATTPWKPATACPKDRTIKWLTIEWVHTGRWIIGCLEAIPVWSIASVWHSTETSAATGHRTLTHWSSSIKSWHNKHLLSFLQFLKPFLNLDQVISKEISFSLFFHYSTNRSEALLL